MPRTEELQKDATFDRTIKFLSTVSLVHEEDNLPMVQAISYIAELSAKLRESEWRPIEEIQAYEGDIYWVLSKRRVARGCLIGAVWHYDASGFGNWKELEDITQFKPYVPTPPKNEQ